MNVIICVNNYFPNCVDSKSLWFSPIFFLNAFQNSNERQREERHREEKKYEICNEIVKLWNYVFIMINIIIPFWQEARSENEQEGESIEIIVLFLFLCVATIGFDKKFYFWNYARNYCFNENLKFKQINKKKTFASKNREKRKNNSTNRNKQTLIVIFLNTIWIHGWY